MPDLILVLAGGLLAFVIAVDVAAHLFRLTSLLAYIVFGAMGGWVTVVTLSLTAGSPKVLTGEEDVPYAAGMLIGALVCAIYWAAIRRPWVGRKV